MKRLAYSLVLLVVLAAGLSLPLEAQFPRPPATPRTVQKLNDGTSGAPILAFASEPTLGFWRSGAGVVTLQGALTTTGNILLPAAGTLTATGRSSFSSSADSLAQVKNNGGTTGMELNTGTPSLGTCTGGSLTSGSRNFAGEVTGTTGGSCVINFGTPNFTNAPFCTLSDESGTPAVMQLSARSASSITIAGITSGHNVIFICFGRI